MTEERITTEGRNLVTLQLQSESDQKYSWKRVRLEDIRRFENACEPLDPISSKDTLRVVAGVTCARTSRRMQIVRVHDRAVKERLANAVPHQWADNGRRSTVSPPRNRRAPTYVRRGPSRWTCEPVVCVVRTNVSSESVGYSGGTWSREIEDSQACDSPRWETVV